MKDKRKSTESSLVVNGSQVCVDPKTHSSLLAYLRNEKQLTGSKQGCATGHCGACNVMVNGVVTQSCQVKLSSADQTHVETIENIVETALGKRITEVLMRFDAAQCGYCLPGIVVAAYSELLNSESPDPIRALERNLCRCGTHSRILNALQEVMETQDDSA